MARVRLTGRIQSDFGIVSAEIPQMNFILSLTGKINISSPSHTCLHNCWLSLSQNLAADDVAAQLSPNTKRGLITAIATDFVDLVNLLALRRRNIPLPPTGAIAILKQGRQENLKGATLRRGDTHVFLATIYGDFPAEPELVFALRDNSDLLSVKSNRSTQGDITVLEITDAGMPDVTQKLTAQIVIHPNETSFFDRRKILFYTLEVVDVLADEVYTIESDKVTIEPDVVNYFSTL